MFSSLRNHWPRMATIGALLLIAAFSAYYIFLGFTNYTRFRSGIDLAGYGQALHHLSHFRLPYSTLKDQVLWGDHAHFILVFIAPIYRLLPDVRVLLLIQALTITTAAWPLFRVSRKLTHSNLFALSLTYAYLAFAGIQYALNVDFHPSVLTGGLLIWAIAGLIERRWRMYWIAILLALLTREDAATIIFMIGLSLLFRRQWKHGALTMAISAMYFLVVVYRIMPMWTPDNAALTYLDTDDTSVWGVVRGFFLYPQVILQNMFDTPEKRETIHTLFAAFGYLPLLSFFTYLGVAPIFYARFPNPNEYRWLLENHSNANITPILVFGALFAVVTIVRLLQRSRVSPRVIQVLLPALSLLLLWSVHRTAWSRETIPLRTFFTNDYWGDTVELQKIRPAFEKARAQIPSTAGVTASSGFLAHVSNRDFMVNYPTITSQTDWILVSHRVNPWPFSHGPMREEIAWLEQQAAFEKVSQESNVWLFKRRATGP